jgi:hypothetical protein
MMRQWFFLRTKWATTAFFTALLAPVFFSGPLLWLIFLVAIAALFVARRREALTEEATANHGQILLSPADGVITKVLPAAPDGEGVTVVEVRIRVSTLRYWGLHLPAPGENAYLKQSPGPRLHRKQLADLDPARAAEAAHTDLVLAIPRFSPVRLRFLHCVRGMAPRIWMKSGDRGKSGACFGHYPFGGSLIVYVPQPGDILVVEGENVTAGESVLAAFRPLTEDPHGF